MIQNTQPDGDLYSEVPRFCSVNSEGTAHYVLATYHGQYGVSPSPNHRHVSLALEFRPSNIAAPFLFTIYSDEGLIAYFSGNEMFPTLEHALLQSVVEHQTHPGRWRIFDRNRVVVTDFASPSEQEAYFRQRAKLLRLIYTFRPALTFDPEPLFVAHVLPVPSLFDETDPEMTEMMSEVESFVHSQP